MLHRVIFDQHRPLVCREIVHKVKETVKRNVHSKKKRKVVVQSLSGPSPAVIRVYVVVITLPQGLPSLLLTTIHVKRLNRMQAFRVVAT
jgi:hypothetical protein